MFWILLAEKWGSLNVTGFWTDNDIYQNLFFPRSVDSSRKEPCAVYTAAEGVSQELGVVRLRGCERLVQKQTSNCMTASRLSGFGLSI